MTDSNKESKTNRFSRPNQNSGPVQLKNNPGIKTNAKQLLSNLSFSARPVKKNGASKDSSAKTTPPKRRGLRSAAPKAATSLTIRDVKKKFGARRPYSIEALLSLRMKCKHFLEVEEIEGVMQEGIGEETGVKGIEQLRRDRKKSSSSSRRKINVLKLDAVKKSMSADSTPPTEKTMPKEKTSEPAKEKTTAKDNPVEPKSTQKEKAEAPKYNTDPLEDVAPLKKSSNRWVAGAKRSPKARLLGKVKGILNKITFERFDTLSADLIEFIKEKIKTADQLKLVVSELFTKTVAEKHFGPLYADLCCQLQALSFSDPDYDQVVTFKVALVNQCQHEFENVFKPVDLGGVETNEEREMKILQAKMRALGTVQFIGQLYMKDLLPDKICRVCLINLVSSNPTDLQIESAYQLLLTIGKKYDSKERGKQHLDSIFGALENNSKSESSLKQRTKILVSIVKDVRKNDWVPPVKIEKAKTIEEIHQEFEAERGKIQISGRGQATFDEYIVDATSKYSKQLKFALSGGCAIRRLRGDDGPLEGKSDNAPDSTQMDALLLGSSKMIVDDAMVVDLTANDDEEEEVESIPLMSPEDREEIKDSFIRTFMNNRQDKDFTEQKALDAFVLTVKKMGWDSKETLVDNILNFAYDMSEGEASPLGEAFAVLVGDYIPLEAFTNGLGEWCEFFTSCEMDAPKLCSYFADYMVPLLRKGTASLTQVNEALQKDKDMDKPAKGKNFGRRGAILANILKAAPDLEYSATEWGLEEAQVADWKKEYALG